VADNGPGVPHALREDIFLPFFTSKQHGTGVGLSFARQIVLLHKGVIGLCADEGEGAVRGRDLMRAGTNPDSGFPHSVSVD
jgi:nitrogen-specific signal transduction histidine kinase